MSPLVSVIVPIYNGEKYLAETIRSVFHQTYSNWELILVDDGSTDKTSSIIDNFLALDARVRKISISQSSGGPAHPRNLGVELANGEFIAFLDADDLWAHNKLDLQIDFLLEKEVDIVHCGGAIINAVGKEIGTVQSARKHHLFELLFGPKVAMMINNPVILSSSLLKRESFTRFRQDKDLAAVEDWFFWIESNLSGRKIGVLNKILMSYRSHEDSISKMLNEVHFLRGFQIYTVLLLEKKIGLMRFWVICSLQLLNLGRLRLLGKF